MPSSHCAFEQTQSQNDCFVIYEIHSLGGTDDTLAAEIHAKFPEFSESLILSFLDAFTFYDQRQTKSIGFASLGPALMILGLNPRQTELRAAIREVILVPFEFSSTFASY